MHNSYVEPLGYGINKNPYLLAGMVQYKYARTDIAMIA